MADSREHDHGGCNADRESGDEFAMPQCVQGASPSNSSTIVVGVRGESPILYAHRGASLELPENTLEAFARAFDLGANAIETDAHMTRDGRVVLSHDSTGERMAGVPMAIRDATLNDVRTWNVGAGFTIASGGERRAYRMPTLDETLEAFPNAFFNIDVKQTSPDMIQALLRSIRAAHATNRVRIASFSARNLRRARALGYDGALGMASSDLAKVMLLPRLFARRLPIAGDAAQVPERAWGMTFASQSAIDRLHACGLRVDFWTIDDPERAKWLFAMGADGIVTNDVRGLRAVLSG
ncbi:MAG: hypothetical protein FWD73_03490 [Polyangiaceae bacterium]|nr:hypothetical protein [Polyangiaceae bacterium]